MYNNVKATLDETIETLKNSKHSNVVGQFVIRAVNDKTIEVNLYSEYHIISNITKEIATKEFYEGKNDFELLMKEAKLFSTYCKDKVLVYHLCMDYGGGAVLICKEDENGKLKFNL